VCVCVCACVTRAVASWSRRIIVAYVSGASSSSLARRARGGETAEQSPSPAARHLLINHRGQRRAMCSPPPSPLLPIANHRHAARIYIYIQFMYNINIYILFYKRTQSAQCWWRRGGRGGWRRRGRGRVSRTGKDECNARTAEDVRWRTRGGWGGRRRRRRRRWL